MTGANPSASRIEFIDDSGSNVIPSGGTAASSSDLSGSFPASAAFDENDTTFWVAGSTTDGDPTTVSSWISYDFGSDQTFSGVQVRSRPDSFGVNEGIRFGLLQYSSDNVIWNTLFNVINNLAYSASGTVKVWEDDQVYTGGHRYWRLNVTGVQNGSGNRFAAQQVALHTDSNTSVDIVDAREVITSYSDDGSENSNNSAVSALDNQTSTRFAADATDETGILTWDFGPVNAPDVTDISITNADEVFGPGESPSDWDLEYSDDGVMWTSALNTSGDTGWTQNETRSFSVP